MHSRKFDHKYFTSFFGGRGEGGCLLYTFNKVMKDIIKKQYNKINSLIKLLYLK